MERTQFTFYRSFATAIKRIRSKAARCDAYEAIINFALDGTEPDVDSMAEAAAAVFDLAKPFLLSARRKAEGGAVKPASTSEDNDKLPASCKQVNDKIPESNAQQDKDKDIDKDKEQKLSISGVTIQTVIDAWNAQGLTKVSDIKRNTKRYKNLVARCGEYGADVVVKAINNVSKSKFLRGDNNRGWACSLDWLLLPSNFQKVLEGSYNDRPAKGYDPKFIGDHSKPIKTADGKTLYEKLLEEEQAANL